MAAKQLAQSMSSAFNEFFIDAIEGRIKQFKDYLLDFLKSIAKAMSKMLSDILAQKLLFSFIGPLGGSPGGGQPMTPSGGNVLLNNKALTGARGKSSVEIINQSGVPMQAEVASQTTDIGGTVMTIVMDGISRNKGGSRDALKGILAV